MWRNWVVWLPLIGILAIGAGFGSVYALSEWRLRAIEAPVPFTYPISSDSETIDKGRHLARTRGCFGCHGQKLEGRVHQWEWVGLAVAPNLAQYAKENSASTIEAAVRHGVDRQGRALWSMPAYNYRHLVDDDMAALIAFLRSAEVISKSLPRPRLGFRTRWAIATGAEDHMAEWVSSVPPLLAAGNPTQIRGEYLAMTTCNECHGLDLRGSIEPDFTTPDLAIVAAYSKTEFQSLMRTGIGVGDRINLGLMTVVAKDRFAHFTEQEISDLYEFLRKLPSQPIPQDVFWRPGL